MHLPPEDVYEFLLGFEQYAKYSKHLTEVRQNGDGSPGTTYDLVFTWWRLSYTARSEVTAVDPPHRIDWRIIKDIDAVGSWQLEPLTTNPPETEVTLNVKYRPESADDSIIDLPRFITLDWVIAKVKPKIQAEAERVVRRIVADLEGTERDVDLEITTS